MNRLGKIFLESIPIIVVAFLVAIGSFYVGYNTGVQNPETILIKGITNIGDDDVTADFDVFWEALSYVREEHIDGADVEDQELVNESIKGMVRSLDDPNTIFLPAEEDTKKFQEDVSGVFGGIGAEIGMRNGHIMVVAPLKTTPAERAGLLSGDLILAVDGKLTDGLDVIEAVKIIRGEVGSEVVLTTFREGWDQSRDVPITRERIEVPTLDYTILDEDIVHVEMYSFNRNSEDRFREAVFNSLVGGAKGMILDLRNNPGGFLDVAVSMAGWFLDRGSLVVSEEFRSGDTTPFRVSGNEVLTEFPVVVLINGGSASASEILAGALRDHLGVKLVGQQSFGKGTVQELKTLQNKSGLKLTIAKWLLPSGDVIEKQGLVPDVEVIPTEEDFEENRDPQLDKAVEVLREEMQGAKFSNFVVYQL